MGFLVTALGTGVAFLRFVPGQIGFGVAVLAVQTLTVPLNHLIHTYLLRPGAWAWAGMPDVDLGFLGSRWKCT